MVQPLLPNQPLKSFYPWLIVGIVAMMQILVSTRVLSIGVFIEPWETQFGWSKNDISLGYAISLLTAALASPFSGYIGDRFGAKISGFVGILIFFVAMILMSFITELWHFWLIFGIFLGIAQAIILVPLVPAAMTWFRRKLDVAMGIVFLSWGIGPAFITPLLVVSLNNFGWRVTFFLLAIVSTLIMGSLLILFKNRPSDINMDAYGTLPGDLPIVGMRPPAILLKEFNHHMRKTRAYWNLSSIHFLGCVGHSMIIVWIIPFAMDRGFTLMEASFIYTLMSTVSIVTRFLAPILCDRYGMRGSLSTFFILQGFPVLVLAYTQTSSMFILMAIIFGIGWGGESGGFPIFNRKYFGQAPMGSPHGVQLLGAGVGMALGGWMGGAIYDIFDSYSWALILSGVASLGGAFSIMILENPSKLLIPDWIQREKNYNELNVIKEL
jgi:MFS family permease